MKFVVDGKNYLVEVKMEQGEKWPETLQIPEGIVGIERKALDQCGSEKVIMPSTLKAIRAFGIQSYEVKDLILNEGLEHISRFALPTGRGATVHFPSTLKTLCRYQMPPNHNLSEEREQELGWAYEAKHFFEEGINGKGLVDRKSKLYRDMVHDVYTNNSPIMKYSICHDRFYDNPGNMGVRIFTTAVNRGAKSMDVVTEEFMKECRELAKVDISRTSDAVKQDFANGYTTTLKLLNAARKDKEFDTRYVNLAEFLEVYDKAATPSEVDTRVAEFEQVASKLASYEIDGVLKMATETPILRIGTPFERIQKAISMKEAQSKASMRAYERSKQDVAYAEGRTGGIRKGLRVFGENPNTGAGGQASGGQPGGR